MPLLRTTALTLAAATLLAGATLARAQMTDWHVPMRATSASRTAANRPSWVEETLEPSNRAHIVRMVEGSKADVVLLDGGLYQGFRTGVICTVQHQTGAAQLIIVASEETRSAALILSNDIILVPGDEVRPSTL